MAGRPPWGLAFLALPLPAAVLAGLAALARPPDVPIAGARAPVAGLLGHARARRWALGELLAASAWAGTLVFSGALFTEVHGTSPTTAGIALALVAAAFLAGSHWASRSDPSQARRRVLESTVAASAGVALTWSVTPSAALTLVVFGAAAFLAATRTVSGTVYGFAVAGDLGREVGAIRAATTQIGYLIGSLVGGLALAAGGFDALAVAFGGLLFASTFPYLCVRHACRSRVALEAV